jgi:putative transposase
MPRIASEASGDHGSASFHKSPCIRKIIENVGFQLLYLSPYSPDLHPIKHYWAWLKNKLSDLWRSVTNFYDRLFLALNLNYEATSVSDTLLCVSRENGSVCRELFNVHRGCFSVVDKDIPNTCTSVKKLRKADIKTFDQILEDDGKYNCAQLRKISYREDRWKLTK